MGVRISDFSSSPASRNRNPIGILFAAGGLWFGHAAWRARRQLVTLDVPSAPLAAVLRRIEWQVWKKIRVEESLADVRVTLHVKDKPLSYVLDRLAEQAGARWSTLYAVYGNNRALRALDSSLQSDGKFEAAGWTRIAPTLADLDQPDPDKSGPRVFQQTPNFGKSGPALGGDSGRPGKVGRIMVKRGPDGQLEVADLAGRMMVRQGPGGQSEIWSPKQMFIESSLSARLAGDPAIKNSAVTADSAVEIARKVKGRWTTFLTFHKWRNGPYAPYARSNTAWPGHVPPPRLNGRFADLTPEQRVQHAREHLARASERRALDAK